MNRLAKLGLAAAAGALALGTARQRAAPSACPYSQRWLLLFPRPGLTRARLAAILEPRAGERLLEIGPGPGHFAFAMAERVGTRGTVAALDLQQEMLDALGAGARRRGLDNVELRQGDATALPYEDSSFDGAVLVTVLGEIPDQDAALLELRRVLRPGGRVVFGETVLDPHLVPLGSLKRRAEAAGLRFERTAGLPPFGFYARFAAP